MYPLWNALAKAKTLRWIELSHPLTNDSPYWAGIPEGTVELGKTVYDWGQPMLDCLIQSFKFPGQFGTHIDFPGHFVPGTPLSEAYGVKDLVFPLCVVDVTKKVAQDPCYPGLRGPVRSHPRRGLRGAVHRLVEALAGHGSSLRPPRGRQ